jgi:galactose mutarotase-like enzyme
MIETIENEFLKIEVDLAGAELKSIYHKERSQEYVWQGSPDWWPRRAPVLFPIVGKLNQNGYRFGEKSFSLPQHGFARDTRFNVQSNNGEAMTFCLSANAGLLEKYPFQFDLKINYRLKENILLETYEVVNPGSEPIYFSIGAHPGFALQPGEILSDYYIEFEKAETLDRHLLEEGLFNGSTERVLTNEKILNIEADAFKRDAIVFKGMKSRYVFLKSRKSPYSIKFDFPDFPYFGIWSKPGASFICLEPWCGLADRKGFEGELKDKEGIQMLGGGQTFSRGFSIEVE